MYWAPNSYYVEICHAVPLSVIVVFKLYHFHLGANAAFQSSLDFRSHLEVVCICCLQMIWTWTQPVRPSCVQFSLLVNQASFTEAPAARSKESAVCRENQLFAHLSLPWSIGWVALSFLVRSFVRLSRHGNTRPNLTSSCPTPPNPYIFWKLMIIAIQKWIRNTNTKTKTNTKTMTKTKTPRE